MRSSRFASLRGGPHFAPREVESCRRPLSLWLIGALQRRGGSRGSGICRGWARMPPTHVPFPAPRRGMTSPDWGVPKLGPAFLFHDLCGHVGSQQFAGGTQVKSEHCCPSVHFSHKAKPHAQNPRSEHRQKIQRALSGATVFAGNACFHVKDAEELHLGHPLVGAEIAQNQQKKTRACSRDANVLTRAWCVPAGTHQML